jgi:hypothetical protein
MYIQFQAIEKVLPFLCIKVFFWCENKFLARFYLRKSQRNLRMYILVITNVSFKYSNYLS